MGLPYTAAALRDRALAVVEEVKKSRHLIKNKGVQQYFCNPFISKVKMAFLMNSLTPKPLPASFRMIPQEKIRQILPTTTAYAKAVPYKEGAFGYAMRDPKIRKEMPFTFGFYDQQNKKYLTGNKLTRKDIVIDKFHLYKMGTVTISQKCRLFLMRSWSAHIQLERFHRMGFPDKKWDLYVSLKFEGPFYGKSKSKENNVWMDRVVLVEK